MSDLIWFLCDDHRLELFKEILTQPSLMQMENVGRGVAHQTRAQLDRYVGSSLVNVVSMTLKQDRSPVRRPLLD